MLQPVRPPFAISGAGASASSGTVVFSNSNNVSFGQAGSTVTATATLPAYSAGISTNGNTAGDTGYGTNRLVLIGGNNITLSGSTNGGSMSLTISGPNVGGAQTGISGIVVSNTTYTSGTVSFSNANGISFGSSAGQAITASYTVPTVTNSSWTVSDTATSGTVARLAFTNLNGVTLSLSTGANGSHTIVGSHNAITSQSTQFLAMTLGGNTAGTTTFHATNNVSLFLNGGNGITLSGNGSTVTISGITQSVQTQGITGDQLSIGVSTGGNTAGNTTVNSGQRFVLVGSNGITLSQGTGAGSTTVTISGVTVPAQTNQTGGIYHVGNTTGESSSSTFDARTLSFRGDGIVSVGWSNSSVRISATQSNQAVSNSAGSFTFQTLNFSNANNVTWGTSAGGIVTASVAAPGAAAENNWHHALGANTAGNTTASGSTIGLSGINLTISGTNDSVFNLSVPATSSLSATGAASISVNGSTISIGAKLNISAGTTSNDLTSQFVFSNSNGVSFGLNGSTVTADASPVLKWFDNAVVGATSLSNPGDMTLYVFPLTPVNEVFPGNMTCSTMMLNVTQSMSTAATFTNRVSIGFYSSVNSTQLTLVHSGSTSWGTNAGNMQINDSFGGTRWLTIHSSLFDVAPVFSAGVRYWCAIWNRTSNNAGSMSFNFFGNITAALSNARSGVMGLGSVANSTRGWQRFHGIYSVTFSTAMPGALAASDINKSVAQVLMLPQVIFNNVHSDGVI